MQSAAAVYLDRLYKAIEKILLDVEEKAAAVGMLEFFFDSIKSDSHELRFYLELLKGMGLDRDQQVGRGNLD